MKRISKWAQRHPIAARLIITLSHLLIMTNGLLAGLFLFFNDWQHASYTLFFLITSFTLLFIFYPKRGQKTGLFKYSYRSQKIHDFGLVFFSFLMISVGSNNWLVKNITTVSTSSPTATFIIHKQKKNSKRQLKKQLRTELRALKKEFKKRKNKKGSKLVRILLTLLVFGAAIGLGALIAGLACHLSCSGYSGLATLVGIGGIGGIAILVGIINRKIWFNNPRYQTNKN
jgi:hypothetical protein